jgi:HK97 family phage major capsid protein
MRDGFLPSTMFRRRAVFRSETQHFQSKGKMTTTSLSNLSPREYSAEMEHLSTEIARLGMLAVDAGNRGNGAKGAELMAQVRQLQERRRELEATSELARPEPSVRQPNYAAVNADATATEAYARAFDRFIRAGKRVSLTPDERAALEPGSERHTLTMVSDSGGGYTVPAHVSSAMEARIPAISEVVHLVYKPPVTSDKYRRPRVRRHGTYGSIFTSAFVGSWTGEIPGASAGQNEPSFGAFEVDIRKYRALARVSVDLADDNDVDLMEWLGRDGGENAILERERVILVGSGIGSEPMGVMNMPSASSSPTEDQVKTVDIEGSTSNTISNSTTDAGSAPKLMDLAYDLPAQYRRMPSCRWVMNSATFKKVRKLIDADRRPLYHPEAGLLGGTDGRLLDWPVTISEWMPDDGTDGNKPILFGPLELLYVPVRKDIVVTIAPERYIDTDEIGIFLHQRLGVGLPNCDAFRIGVV